MNTVELLVRACDQVLLWVDKTNKLEKLHDMCHNNEYVIYRFLIKYCEETEKVYRSCESKIYCYDYFVKRAMRDMANRVAYEKFISMLSRLKGGLKELKMLFDGSNTIEQVLAKVSVALKYGTSLDINQFRHRARALLKNPDAPSHSYEYSDWEMESMRIQQYADLRMAYECYLTYHQTVAPKLVSSYHSPPVRRRLFATQSDLDSMPPEIQPSQKCSASATICIPESPPSPPTDEDDIFIIEPPRDCYDYPESFILEPPVITNMSPIESLPKPVAVKSAW